MAGLYIHIPFCHSKCSYCDFYSGLRADGVADRYVGALLAELSLRSGEIMEPYRTIYFGGGTPSVLSADVMSRLLAGVSERVDVSNAEEITVEVNPEDVTAELLSRYRDIGINRISMGVQAFDDRLLAAINRRHSAARAIEAIDMLHHGGWNYSIDLIYGLPGQSLEQWHSEIGRLLSLRSPHFSAYLLSYEPGTRLYAMLSQGKVSEADEITAENMYAALTQQAAAAGYAHYEISNFSLPGCHSRHNSSYWDMTPYLGLGASAHSFDGSCRRFNSPDIKRYMAAMEAGQPFAQTDDEDIAARLNDMLLTGLRTARGLSLDAIAVHFGNEYVTTLLREAATHLRAGTLLHLTIPGAGGSCGSLVIPECHWLHSDSIIRDLLFV